MRTLTISGTGVIDLGEEPPEDYGPWWFSAPWDAYNTAIKKIVINEGITGIDDDALNGGVMVESVVLPMSLTDFSAWDFSGTDNLTYYGFKGSHAESVAIQNDIPFVALKGNSDIHSVKVSREIVLTIGKKSINKNGIISKLDVPAQLINSRTMVPLRAIFEALGAYVHWEDSTQTITAIKEDTVVILVIGKNSINVNGVDKPLDVPAMLIAIPLLNNDLTSILALSSCPSFMLSEEFMISFATTDCALIKILVRTTIFVMHLWMLLL